MSRRPILGTRLRGTLAEQLARLKAGNTAKHGEPVQGTDRPEIFRKARLKFGHD